MHAPGTPCWFDLGSPDLDESVAFYGGLFGWTAEDAGGGYRTLHLDGKLVGGLGPKEADGRPYWTMYVAVEDVDATAAVARAAGATVLVEPVDTPGAARMAMLADVEGAPFSVWKAAGHGGADVAGQVEPPGFFRWFELTCRRPEAQAAFCSKVFGWVPDPVDENVGYVSFHLADRTPVAGLLPMRGEHWPGPDVLPAHWMLYVAVADADACAARAKELGGEVAVAPTDIPPGRFAVLDDPHGAVFSVIEPPASAPS